MSALLQAPPVWYLVQHSESEPLNFGMPGGTLPLGKIASHFSFGLILAHGRSWVLVASFFRSFGFSSWSDFLCFFFCCCFSSGSLPEDVDGKVVAEERFWWWSAFGRKQLNCLVWIWRSVKPKSRAVQSTSEQSFAFRADRMTCWTA